MSCLLSSPWVSAGTTSLDMLGLEKERRQWIAKHPPKNKELLPYLIFLSLIKCNKNNVIINEYHYNNKNNVDAIIIIILQHNECKIIENQLIKK